ncbi:hypothetical protein SBA3_4780008 [Candidatus Sulfopaludibacter sp. SbA3]|nr:hypothetical protein SBA3_4780008 [Candidatus Sulfopaludibacter sp. SbA3]
MGHNQVVITVGRLGQEETHTQVVRALTRPQSPPFGAEGLGHGAVGDGAAAPDEQCQHLGR